MRLFASIGIILLVVVLQSHCQQDLTVGSTQENLDLVSRSVTNLAQKISLAISSPKSKTELFSPVSIAGALSLLLLGSGGTTRDELTKLLGFENQQITFADIHKSFGRLFKELVSNEPTLKTSIPWRENDKCNNPDYDDEEDGYYQPPKSSSNQGGRSKRDADSHYISVANGVFLDNNLPLNPNYKNLTKKYYAGEISRMPLSNNPVKSSQEINRWVQHATGNKIREIVSPEQVSNAPMVLASALYFKAKWETMFIEPDTRPRPFYINGRESPPIDIYTMATSGCFPFYEDKQLDVKIVGLPYQEGKSTMYIIMPNQSDRQKIRTFQTRVNVGQVNEFIDRMVVKTGTILLPKMKLENTLGLKDVLLSQGLQNIFSPYLSNLTAITKDVRAFDNMNRFDQPLSTSTPMPITITRKQSSPRPRPSAQPTSTQDINIMNQRGTPYSVTPPVQRNTASPTPPPPTQPIRSSSVPPIKRPIKIGLKETDCNLTNNCFYSERTCNCYPNAPVYTDDRGCYLRPWIIQQNCPQEKQEISHKDFAICHATFFNRYELNRGRCSPDCVYTNQYCYCCEPPGAGPVATQTTQQSTIPHSSVNYQQTSNPSIDVQNRFSSNAISTPPPPPVCRDVYSCNYFGYNCYTERICSLVNYENIPLAGNSRRRNKRQTQNNSPPQNLYVGDILHKVTLDINEQGTEGGAVTAVVIDRISSSFNMRVDGPFLIYLRNDVTKLPLFYGAVFDPRP